MTQPMAGPCSRIFIREHASYIEEDVAAKTRKLKACFNYEAQQDLRSRHNADFEGEMADILATEVTAETNREVFTDIRNNAGVVVTGECFEEALEKAHAALYKKLKEYYQEDFRPNWLITSPGAMDGFKAPDNLNANPMNTHVTYKGMTVILDPLFPTRQAIIGFKGNEFESPYVYGPYVPMTHTPVVLDPDTFCPRRGLLTRYSKKLVRGGAICFARLQWSEKPEQSSDSQ